jgi:hypothetical protein
MVVVVCAGDVSIGVVESVVSSGAEPRGVVSRGWVVVGSGPVVGSTVVVQPDSRADDSAEGLLAGFDVRGAVVVAVVDAGGVVLELV